MGTNTDHILNVISRTVQQNADRPAIIVDGNRSFTYSELWTRVLRTARYISEKCLDRPYIAISLPKSAEYIVCMLGCWLAGKAFVPVGYDLPEPRRRFILKEADITLSLGKVEYARSQRCSPAMCPESLSPEKAAYVIYSSGTTGTPKGIVVSHSGLPNLAKCQSRAFEIYSSSRFLWFLSTNFDASISDILVTLTSGATLMIETQSAIDTSARLLDIVGQRGITHTDLPPSLLRLLDVARCPECLHTIVIGGEAADIQTVRNWAERLNLVCVYGPTEATICTSLCKCTPDWNRPLIGRELSQTIYHIFDGESLDADEGELWISGPGLAIGYLNKPALTQEKFPVHGQIRYYRTADRVRRTGSGEIEFLGRMDRQVKFHGQLVELEEIEKVISSLRCVGRCAVVKRFANDADKKELLAAFIIPAEGGYDGENDLVSIIRKTVRAHLPEWMMPGYIGIISDMPTTPSGKIDYSALRRITISHRNSATLCAKQYSSELSERIAALMADILKTENFDEGDDFIANGADSLDCLTLIGRLGSIGVDISVQDLRAGATPLAISSLRSRHSSSIMSNTLEHEYSNVSFVNDGPMASGVKDVFLTGATGFLGSHLLAQLLSIPRYSRSAIYCLVRCDEVSKGLDRIIESFVRLGLDTSKLGSVRVIQGDLSQPLCGMTCKAYDTLSERVSDVFHCAAKVNIIDSYSDLYQSNITATKNVVDFCTSGLLKRLHYASTLSVFVSTNRNVRTAFESDLLETACTIYGGYAQTKYVAEKILLHLLKQGMPVNVLRLGLLCGSRQTGVGPTNDMFGMFIRGAMKAGVLPADKSGELAVDISPVDTVSSIICDIAEKSVAGVYHIAAQKPLTYRHLYNFLRSEFGIHIMDDYRKWLDTIDRSIPEVNTLVTSLCRLGTAEAEQFRHLDLFQTSGITFDMTNAKALTTARCEWDDDLLKLYIDAL